jgi:uncharacterized PurR-regulated membrane protein YhhQ (DUF165 family)
MGNHQQQSAQGALLLAVAAMTTVVVLSNILVQYPVMAQIGALNLADLLTYGAFTYPLAFLVNDLTNRRLGPSKARFVVLAGFLVAVLLSAYLATPRIAIASGTAFLTAQLLDVGIFSRLRQADWWRAPLVSSLFGSVIDTVLFFSLAFAAGFVMLGANDDFAIANAPLLGILPVDLPRWMSWALGDLAVKLIVALSLLMPYKLLRARLAPTDYVAG